MRCKLCGNDQLNLIADSLRNSDGKVYYCPKCDLGILELDKRDMKSYYNEEYRKKFTDIIDRPSSKPQEIFNMRKSFQVDRISLMKPYFSKEKTLLEVGCSAGQFLYHIIDKFEEVVGVELDTNCANFTSEKLGIDVKDKDIKQINWKGKKFDNIVLFQVLEHTEDPIDFLNSLKLLLKDDGKIFIEVPNLYDPLLKLWNVSNYQKFYYHEAHTYYFTEKALLKLLNICNLEPVEIDFIQDYNLYNNLYWYFNNEPQRDCLFGLSEPEFSFSSQFAKVGEEISTLLKETNDIYKTILSKNKLTSNIFIIAENA